MGPDDVREAIGIADQGLQLTARGAPEQILERLALMRSGRGRRRLLADALHRPRRRCCASRSPTCSARRPRRAQGQGRRRVSALRSRRAHEDLLSRRTSGKLIVDPLDSPEAQAMATFEELGLSEPLLEALQHLGYEQPTPIQEEAIPVSSRAATSSARPRPAPARPPPSACRCSQYIDPTTRGGAGARADPDARAVHPGDPGAARVRREEGVKVVAVFGGAPIRDQRRS